MNFFLKILSFLLVSGVMFNSINAQKNKNVSSNITQVTFYSQGAQVLRTAKTSVEAGTTDIVFTGLSNSLDQQSVRVSGMGNFIIMSVKSQVNFLEQQKKSDGIKKLEQQIFALQNKRKQEQNALEVINNEDRILSKN